MMADPIAPAIGLPPAETIAAFRSKLDLRVQASWDEIWQEEHARAFTVTKLMDLQLLGQVRASLDKVIAQGGTFEQWQTGIVPAMKAAGWYGRVESEALTGVDRAVIIGEKRLRTIFDTNLRMARAAGKWARIQALKGKAPFLMYDAVKDRKTRPLHRLWGGLDTGKPVILPVDDPWWDTHFPPCGWGCRCGVSQLSERDMKRRGLTEYRPPELPPQHYRRSIGQVVSVPAGIDPGFAYNPGATSMMGLGYQVTTTLEDVASRNVEAARAWLDQFVETSVYDAFFAQPSAALPIAILDKPMQAAMAARSPVVVLPAGTYRKQIRAGNHPELTPDEYRLIPALIGSPDLVFQQADQVLVFFKIAGRRYRVTIRQNPELDRPNPAVVSFYRVRDEEVTREEKRSTLIYRRPE